MQRRPVILIPVISMILVSLIPSEGRADDLKKLPAKQKLSNSSDSKKRLLASSSVDIVRSQHEKIFHYRNQELQRQFMNLQESESKKMNGKRIQKIIKLQKIKTLGGKLYFIDGVPACGLNYRLQEMNALY